MKISDIANVITEEIIIDRKERKYNLDDVEVNFKFTTKTKHPFKTEYSCIKKYNGQYGMISIYNCNYDDALDICNKFIEKVRKDTGYDIAFPCSNYSNCSCFGYKFQVIFGKEIKGGE